MARSVVGRSTNSVQPECSFLFFFFVFFLIALVLWLLLLNPSVQPWRLHFPVGKAEGFVGEVTMLPMLWSHKNGLNDVIFVISLLSRIFILQSIFQHIYIYTNAINFPPSKIEKSHHTHTKNIINSPPSPPPPPAINHRQVQLRVRCCLNVSININQSTRLESRGPLGRKQQNGKRRGGGTEEKNEKNYRPAKSARRSEPIELLPLVSPFTSVNNHLLAKKKRKKNTTFLLICRKKYPSAVCRPLVGVAVKTSFLVGVEKKTCWPPSVRPSVQIRLLREQCLRPNRRRGLGDSWTRTDNKHISTFWKGN